MRRSLGRPASPSSSRPWVLVLAGAALLLPAPAVLAGSITSSSVWNRENALQRAREQMPAGATVTRERCEEIGVGFDNFRYRCTVWFTTAPDPAPAPAPDLAPDPAPSPAPAP
ncbi:MULTISPECIES: hypothetical protein [Aphanothece]|uniref:hypothetical protein n=1 Tax=Aphanothece TaxID=1121 RepID=UPI00398EF2C4